MQQVSQILSALLFIFILKFPLIPGPLSCPFGVEVNAWSVNEGDGDPFWPDLQYLCVSGTVAMDGGIFITDGIGYTREVILQYIMRMH